MVKLVECMTRQSRGIDFNWHGHISVIERFSGNQQSNRSFEAAMSRRQVVYGLGPAVTSTDSDIMQASSTVLYISRRTSKVKKSN